MSKEDLCKPYTQQEVRDKWLKNPLLKIFISTKVRREWMLSHNLTIIYHGIVCDISFKNMGGGVWEVSNNYNEKQQP